MTPWAAPSTLQGWGSRGEGGARLARYLHDGSFAELMRVPTENAFPLPTMAGEDPARWAALSVHVIPYGGLAAGETLLLSGATGNLGSSAVAVALAMGAGCVVARGRNQAALDLLADRFGPRLRPVRLTGDEATDRAAMSAPADGPNASVRSTSMTSTTPSRTPPRTAVRSTAPASPHRLADKAHRSPPAARPATRTSAGGQALLFDVNEARVAGFPGRTRRGTERPPAHPEPVAQGAGGRH
ncbi:hypothetical protein QF034_000244 [Streptomyces africanus]|uniref:Uncharacterized protein n=1 Tax=Streptomyces africanus TaxID=231024 RepID=A0ABU0QF52_9ACTN|nr:hypothetical protein [Streptomyces africanus]